MVIVVVLAAGLGVGIWWLVSSHEPEVVVKSAVVPAPSTPEVAPRDAAPPSPAGTGLASGQLASGQKEDAVPLAGSESVVSGSSGSPPPAAQQGPTLVEGENKPAGPEVTSPRPPVPSSRVTEGRKKEAKQESSRVTGKTSEGRPESVPPAPLAAPKDNVATQEPSRPSPGSIKVEVERRLSQAGLGQLLVQVDDQLNVVLLGVTETSEEKARAISLARAVSGAAEVRPRINVRLP